MPPNSYATPSTGRTRILVRERRFGHSPYDDAWQLLAMRAARPGRRSIVLPFADLASAIGLALEYPLSPFLVREARRRAGEREQSFPLLKERTVVSEKLLMLGANEPEFH